MSDNQKSTKTPTQKEITRQKRQWAEAVAQGRTFKPKNGWYFNTEDEQALFKKAKLAHDGEVDSENDKKENKGKKQEEDKKGDEKDDTKEDTTESTKEDKNEDNKDNKLSWEKRVEAKKSAAQSSAWRPAHEKDDRKEDKTESRKEDKNEDTKDNKLSWKERLEAKKAAAQRSTWRPACWFYNNALCIKGSDCPFFHRPQKKPREPCRKFAQGLCYRGNNCWYAHLEGKGVDKSKGETKQNDKTNENTEEVKKEESKEVEKDGPEVQKTGDQLQETPKERALDEEILQQSRAGEWEQCTTKTNKTVVRSKATGEVRFTPPTQNEIEQEDAKFADLKKALLLKNNQKHFKAANLAAKYNITLEGLNKDSRRGQNRQEKEE